MRATTRRSSWFLWLLIISVLVPLTACSHASSPAAPSSAPQTASSTATPSALTGTTISGVIANVASASTGVRRQSVTATLTVSVAGTSLTTTADANGSFTLTGVPPIQIVLNFSGTGISATLPLGSVGANDYVQINVTVSAGSATLNTQQVTTPDNTFNADGVVETVDTTTHQFVFSGTTVYVPLTATLHRGTAAIGVADLKHGDHVHVTGVKQGAVVVASDVTAQDEPAPTPAPPPPAPPTPADTGPTAAAATHADTNADAGAWAVDFQRDGREHLRHVSVAHHPGEHDPGIDECVDDVRREKLR